MYVQLGGKKIQHGLSHTCTAWIQYALVRKASAYCTASHRQEQTKIISCLFNGTQTQLTFSVPLSLSLEYKQVFVQT